MKVIKPKVKESTKRIDHVITSLMCVGRIGNLLDNDEIDLRTEEEISSDTSSFLQSLNMYG